ncbi:MAG: Multi-sensor signal transduction histidine kinase [Nitrospira sp.]|jgi:PAS domain S-box-containing protein|nr:MAG: Multi-sensor signal transduction histidine kinase [Nitrospira sp.]
MGTFHRTISPDKVAGHVFPGWAQLGVIGLLIALIFLLDCLTPHGIPVWILYLVPLVLTYRVPYDWVPSSTALACAALTVLCYLSTSSLAGVPDWIPLLNRSVSLGVFAIIAYLIVQQRRMTKDLINAATLEAEHQALRLRESLLLKSANEVRDLYEHAPCGYHSLDQQGLIIAINQTELDWLGYRRDELVGKTRITDLLTPASADLVRRRFPDFIHEGHIGDLELDMVRKDGSILPILLSATAVRDAEGRFVAGRSTILDITERRKADEALRVSHQALEAEVRQRTADLQLANHRLEEELIHSRRTGDALKSSEARFRELVECLPQLIWTSLPDGTCDYVSPQWVQYTGVQEGEHLGSGWLQQLHPDDRQSAIERWQLNVAAVQPFETDFRIRGRDGRYRWFHTRAAPLRDGDGRLVKWLGTHTDVHDRKHAEDVQARLGAIVESSSDAIISKSLDGLVLTWNKSAEDMFGYSGEDIVGRSILLIVPSDRRLEEAMLIEQIKRGTRFQQYETVRTRKDGSSLHVSLTVSPIMDLLGTVTAVSTIARDITERRRSESMLIKKNKDLETLLYVTSHDLKEPLRAIESFSLLLQERYADRLDDKGRDFLMRIVRATQRLDHLLTDILDLSRAQRMDPPVEDVEAELLVQEVLRRLESRIKDSHAQIVLRSPLPRLRVNRTWAIQGIYNLVANALKFSRSGEPPEIEILSYRKEDQEGKRILGLIVRDRGPGVAPEQRDRIFELFRRAVGREVEGTGAGLAIVRQVAERHGGRAWVEPREGGGSEFFLTFGLEQDGAAKVCS